MRQIPISNTGKTVYSWIAKPTWEEYVYSSDQTDITFRNTGKKTIYLLVGGSEKEIPPNTEIKLDLVLKSFTVKSIAGLISFSVESEDFIGSVKTEYAYLDGNIPGTTQVPIFVGDQISKLQHIKGGVVIREDIFTYSGDMITEARTLSTGETKTFKYNTRTFETEVN